MAITYDGANGLFTRLGRLVAIYNLYDTLEETIRETYPDDVLDEFEDDRDIVDGFLRDCGNNANAVVGFKGQLIPYAERLLVKQLKDELGVLTGSVLGILDSLYWRMIDDNETIKGNLFSLGAVTADGDNVGTGVLVASHIDGEARTRETLCAETITSVCTGDAQVSGTPGQETFSFKGGVPLNSIYSYGTRKSGSGSQFNVMNGGGQLLDNSEFEDFEVADTPDDWDIVTGTVTTHIIDNDANQYADDHCLEFKGDGALAAIEIKQPLTGIQPETVYVFGIWINTSGLNAGNIEITMKGTGWVPSADQKIVILNASKPTVYTFYSFFTQTPRDVPSDVALHIKVYGTPTNGGKVFFDRCGLARAAETNDVFWGLFRGDVDFVIEDEFTMVITQDETGLFADFIARVWDKQLPSETDDSETIADSLAS